MDGKSRKKRRGLIIIPVLGMIAGLLLLLYPYAMDKYNEYRNEQAISSMSSVYDRYADNKEVIEEQIRSAHNYNAKLAGEYEGTEQIPEYEELLTFDGEGIMGYVEIPAINVKMMIYHGTDDDTLAIGAGHLEGTSLPVGGSSTHAVITAHSGMKTMRAFDDIRELKKGDRILISVLGKKLIYEVENQETVLPHEMESLKIVPGKDLLTLITCTPYGINDHRLLVHAERIEDAEAVPDASTDEHPETETAEVKEGIRLFDLRTTPLIIAAAVCLGVVIIIIVMNKKEKRKESEQ